MIGEANTTLSSNPKSIGTTQKRRRRGASSVGGRFRLYDDRRDRGTSHRATEFIFFSPRLFSFFFPLFSPRKKGNLRRPQLRTLQTCTERNKPRNLNDDRIRPRPNARLGSDIWPVTAMTSRKIGPYISSPLSDRSDDAECIFAFVLSACGITTFRDISRVKEGCPFFSPRWEGGCLCACSHSATGKSLLTRQSCMRNYSDISAGAKRAIIACSST